MSHVHIPIIFRDSESVYLEFPSIPNGPTGYVRRFPIIEGGLALIKLKDIPDISPPPGHAPSAPRVLAKKLERIEAKVKVARRKPVKYTKNEARDFMTRSGLKRKGVQ